MNPQDEPEPLLDIHALAKLLGIDVESIREWRKGRNRLPDGSTYGPPAVKVGRLLRWQRAAVQQWLDENTERRAVG